MSSKEKQNTKQYPGRSTWIFVIVLVISLPSLMIISGQQAWSKQMLLTQSFERCMEKAPFKNPQKLEDSRPTLEPDDMQKHFDEFNQIFEATGLPPIWNGQKLVAWKEYHQKSIQIAQECHQELGITRPQHDLRGSYSKPVWDPKSQIWQPDHSPG